MLVKLLNEVILLKVITNRGEEITFEDGGLLIGTADTMEEEHKLQQMFANMNGDSYKEYYWK